MSDITYEELELLLEPRFGQGWGSQVGIPHEWVQLVYDLHKELVEIDPDYEIQQVKIKFGGLRFYASMSDKAIDDDNDYKMNDFHNLIQQAESKSYDLWKPNPQSEYGDW